MSFFPDRGTVKRPSSNTVRGESVKGTPTETETDLKVRVEEGSGRLKPTPSGITLEFSARAYVHKTSADIKGNNDSAEPDELHLDDGRKYRILHVAKQSGFGRRELVLYLESI